MKWYLQELYIEGEFSNWCLFVNYDKLDTLWKWRDLVTEVRTKSPETYRHN